jgi:hypothetical protein
MSGELIVMDPYTYSRFPGANKYTLGQDSDLAINPALPSGAVYLVQQIIAIAADSRLSPVLVGTEQEPTGAAYHIRVDLTPDVVNDKLGSSGHAYGTGTLNLWILHDGFFVERMVFSSSDPSFGAAAVQIVMSNFNNVAPIEAPPGIQVEEPSSASTAP